MVNIRKPPGERNPEVFGGLNRRGERTSLFLAKAGERSRFAGLGRRGGEEPRKRLEDKLETSSGGDSGVGG
jgi:hypothetical protein